MNQQRVAQLVLKGILAKFEFVKFSYTSKISLIEDHHKKMALTHNSFFLPDFFLWERSGGLLYNTKQEAGCSPKNTLNVFRRFLNGRWWIEWKPIQKSFWCISSLKKQKEYLEVKIPIKTSKFVYVKCGLTFDEMRWRLPPQPLFCFYLRLKHHLY